MWMLFLSIMFTSLSLQAQNVTIRANNGSTIAAVKDGGTVDSFFGAGGFATWQHEQLSMVLTVSDGTDLTASGQLDNPANNLFTSGTYMQIGKGQASGANTTYATVSLPKGYRFTGYTIKFSKSNETKGSGNGAISFNSNVTARFGETGSNFATYTTSADATNGGTAQTITRTEMNAGDMSNVLYFKLQNTGNSQGSRVLITFESAEFFFTAEEDYAVILPIDPVSNASAVDIPFSTSKVDYGRVENRSYTINGRTYTRMSYMSSAVTDLSAKMHLYEAESIKDGSDIDGITGKVIDYKTGTISSEDEFFRLGREGQEQVYYIETPTFVTLSNGTNNPVGYRITEAEIVYKIPGEQTKYYISYTSGSTTYYLGTNGRFTTTKTEWETDSNGRIHSGNTYLGFTTSFSFSGRTFTFNTYTGAPSNPLYIDNSNRIYGSYSNLGVNYTCYLYHNGTNAALSTDTNNLAYWTTETLTPSANFTLNVYDKDGTNPTSYTNGNGTVKLTGLNNDAVKIGVQGIGLVRATLTLQALDPYLDQMQVVCQDQVQTAVRMTQSFTASDFSVSGGKFYFYLPADCEGHNVLISFEELKSKYFDETYTGGSASHTSRLNFVKSNHYNAFGTSNNNVYTNRSEASNAQLERLKVGTVGTKAFKFNNADEVGTSGGTLTEYPFSLENYAAAPNSGSFTNMQFTVSSEDQELTRYVFTTDETRYNIAPTTATQHRAYAFYEMEVHVQSGLYEPEVEFVKIYENALHGTGQKDDFYGAVITAYDGNGKPGYSSTQEIFKIINEAIASSDVTVKPTGPDKLLYLDFSQLAGVYEITTDEHQSMEDYANTNAKNCLIFIPKGQSAPNNNVAYQTEAGGFHAANDIVITDKEPFYTPYDIQIDGANMAYYERLVSKDSYGKVQNATLIMPFQLTIENGKHTNTDGTYFTLHKMQENQSIELLGDKPYAYFPTELADVTVTTPHTPYLVNLEESQNSTKDGVSFIVSQKGTLIKATTAANSDNDYKYYYVGENSTGTVASGGTYEGGSYSFTNQGTYAGQEIDKTKGVFYFARNRFVNSAELASSIETVKIYPFRSYYVVGDGTAPTRFSTMDIIFGKNENNVEDAIRDLKEKNMDMSVRAGRGTITIAATSDNDVHIIGINGVSRHNFNVNAGETRTVNVPAGIYLVNGVKILVK